jgi:CheY-like chemotaxis protein
VAEDLRPAASARHHRLERVSPTRGPWVHADPTRLAQIVSNLLLNAVKYTPEGGLIRLEVESCDGEAVLRVHDSGVGIAPEMRSRIFDPFVQGDASLAPQGGLGIGLTLVRRLVELHSGRIEVDSPGPGRGSTFTVRLPALARAPAPPPPATSRATTPPRRVLVVDDNRDAADTLAKLLELWGHQVRVVHDGPAALEAAALDPPEIVLLDIGLPGMDGYDVVARLREHPATRASRIVALTGFGQEADRRTALAAGFDDHMAKPVNPEALRELLGRSLADL